MRDIVQMLRTILFKWPPSPPATQIKSAPGSFEPRALSDKLLAGRRFRHLCRDLSVSTEIRLAVDVFPPSAARHIMQFIPADKRAQAPDPHRIPGRYQQFVLGRCSPYSGDEFDSYHYRVGISHNRFNTNNRRAAVTFDVTPGIFRGGNRTPKPLKHELSLIRLQSTPLTNVLDGLAVDKYPPFRGWELDLLRHSVGEYPHQGNLGHILPGAKSLTPVIDLVIHDSSSTDFRRKLNNKSEQPTSKNFIYGISTPN